jgi:hypothetical protein
MGRHRTNGKDPEPKPVSIPIDVPEAAERTRKQEADDIGLTRGTIWKLRRRGMSDTEIVERGLAWQEEQARRREREIARQAGVNAMAAAKNDSCDTRVLSAVPPASALMREPDGIPSYTESQKQKEYYLAQMRRLEYERERGSLVEVERVARVGTGVITATVQFATLFPTLIRDELASTSDPVRCEEIVMREVRRMVEKIHDLESLWADWDQLPLWREFEQWKREHERTALE